MGIGQRTNEHRAKNREYSGVGADAERERENGDRSEGRGFAELPDGEAAIRENQMEPVLNALLATHAGILAPTTKEHPQFS